MPEDKLSELYRRIEENNEVVRRVSVTGSLPNHPRNVRRVEVRFRDGGGVTTFVHETLARLVMHDLKERT